MAGVNRRAITWTGADPKVRRIGSGGGNQVSDRRTRRELGRDKKITICLAHRASRMPNGDQGR